MCIYWGGGGGNTRRLILYEAPLNSPPAPLSWRGMVVGCFLPLTVVSLLFLVWLWVFFVYFVL